MWCLIVHLSMSVHNHFQNYNRLVYHTRLSTHFLIVAGSCLNSIFLSISFPFAPFSREQGSMIIAVWEQEHSQTFTVIKYQEMAVSRKDKQKGQDRSLIYRLQQWGLFIFHLPVFSQNLILKRWLLKMIASCQCWGNPFKTSSSQKRSEARTEKSAAMSSPICKNVVTGHFSYFPVQSWSWRLTGCLADMALKKKIFLCSCRRGRKSKRPETGNSRMRQSFPFQCFCSPGLPPVSPPWILPSEISLFSCVTPLSCVLWDWTISTPDRWAVGNNT